MIGVEYLSESDRTGLPGSRRDDMTVLRRPSSPVVNTHSRLGSHTLEALIDAMRISATLDHPEGNTVCSRVGYLIVGVNQVNDAKIIRFELTRIHSPLPHLVEEVRLATGPVLDALEVTIKASPTVTPDFVDMDLLTCLGKICRSSETRQSCTENVDSPVTHTIASIHSCLNGWVLRGVQAQHPYGGPCLACE